MIIINDLLEKHEGRRGRPYLDTAGKVTIGVGHNLNAQPLPNAVIDLLRDIDVDAARNDLLSLLGGAFQGASPVRQAALLDLRFQLGYGGFREFRRMIACIGHGEWTDAAAELKNSHLAASLPARTQDLITMLHDDALPSWMIPIRVTR